MTESLLITHAHLVVDTGYEIADGWVAITDGTVTAVGPGSVAPPAAPAGPGGTPGERPVIDAGGRLVTAGLINTHHHMYQNLTRAFAPSVDGTLFEWLTTLYPVWAGLDEESVYVSTYVAMAELLMGGCTTSMDHQYVHPRPNLIDAQVRAARDVGFRFHATRGSMTRSVEDGGLPPASVVQDKDAVLADSERLVSAYHERGAGAMIQVALAPCSPFSVQKDVMIETAQLAERLDVRLHTHLAEDHDEDDYCLETYGVRPVDYFEEVGWLTDRSWVAHCVYPDDSEIARLGAAGVGVAHCPSSNMMLAGGTAKVAEMRAAGTPSGSGATGRRRTTPRRCGSRPAPRCCSRATARARARRRR
ncbi:hypothetical protein GCM10025865_06380 [Paraoerskovia sediminicola]|uniref:Amidohydrolase-related domain-containing protein n=1 Tax=Paraoerskovia sediminicola TaxID=1138587 RepID=A0ABN6X975_9CELL|nr:hypothetical protein GCM10025865_06380 [Paraoerskovia sediminicola]